MDYNLESLGDERFQKLCQAILASTYPNVQCTPVSQPDGGRDGFARHETGFIVFQVKYSRDPSSRSERDAIESLIVSEKPKIDALIKRGATSYILLTNISGTSHLDVGSIDRTQSELTAAFGIPTMCWWRDDIERRIEAIDGLIWRYPELLRSVDFLETLTLRSGTVDGKRAFDVFRSYMDTQLGKDAEVKFQQVQIQNSLLDLFTDTPLAFAREKQPKPGKNSCEAEYFQDLSFDHLVDQQVYLRNQRHVVKAAEWLLKAAPTSGLQRIVLEGAPGQGKSTVTQYLCQVNRIRTTKSVEYEGKIPANHMEHAVRLPFRVDLRDYSSWIAGHDPFAGSKAVPRPSGASDGLESFIAHQVKSLSGGKHFDADMLDRVVRDAHCLIVLDGFDEVADLPSRQRIIDQTRSFGARIDTTAASVQLIVTSRPNAFILSAGFPEREWMHLSLRPLQLDQISEYADKWIAAKELTPIKGREFKDLLGDRVSRPHIRSLAQNPMQLAILLNLISTKGLSLPDKRTALYDSYMDLFFGREAEKDEVVRENRDILMQIHEYVAWLLQTDAERPGGAGSMTQVALEEVVRNFLKTKGHDEDVMSLFKGAVERVGALVSRVQGMLEFEVQPLREFFAGRYLYVSAPYSTVTVERGGARPRRFAALARRPYWFNVARFYAGCYNSGELASLLSGLEEVYDDDSEAMKSHALQLGLLLLSDWVFAQEPRIVANVISFLTKGQNLERVVCNPISWEEQRLSLPIKCGRGELGKAAMQAVFTINDRRMAKRIGDVAVLNTSFRDRYAAYRQSEGGALTKLDKAVALGLLREAPRPILDELFAELGPRAVAEAVAGSRWGDLSPGEIGIALEVSANQIDSGSPLYNWDDRNHERVLLRANWFLSPAHFSVLKFNDAADFRLASLHGRYGFPTIDVADHESSAAPHLGLSDFVAACETAANADRQAWNTTLVPWSGLVEAGRRTWGQTLPMMTLAATAAGIQSKSIRAIEYDDLLASQMPLAERARHARLRTNLSWWEDQWSRATTDNDKLWMTLITLAWGSGQIIDQLTERLTKVVDDLDDEWFWGLSQAVIIALNYSPGGRPRVTGLDQNRIGKIGSTRLAFLISYRLGDSSRRKAIVAIARRGDIVDPPVATLLFDWLTTYAYRDPSLWDEAIRFCEQKSELLRAYKDNSDLLGREVYFHSRSTMTYRAAEGFLANARYRPMALLEAASSTIRHSGSSDRRPLASVAESEVWFA